MDFYRLIERIASEGGPYSAIMDLSEVIAMRVSAKTIRTLAANNPAVPEGTPRVIVAKKDDFLRHRASLPDALKRVTTFAYAYAVQF
jgi:hypothetical protein